MYLYIKALHIIFIVTWFAGLFYMVRLFVYNTEANGQQEPVKTILQQQYSKMMSRLWWGITWPSAILTLVFGSWMLYLYGGMQNWLWVKLCFVAVLYLYHFSLHHIYQQQKRGVFRYSSLQLRVWNEVATLLLLSIVFLVVLKNALSMVWGIVGLFVFTLLLLLAIRVYQKIRQRQEP